jgi:hypothetical protein
MFEGKERMVGSGRDDSDKGEEQIQEVSARLFELDLLRASLQSQQGVRSTKNLFLFIDKVICLKHYWII